MIVLQFVLGTDASDKAVKDQYFLFGLANPLQQFLGMLLPVLIPIGVVFPQSNFCPVQIDFFDAITCCLNDSL